MGFSALAPIFDAAWGTLFAGKRRWTYIKMGFFDSLFIIGIA
jgi:hypothetical protein